MAKQKVKNIVNKRTEKSSKFKKMQIVPDETIWKMHRFKKNKDKRRRGH